VHVGAQELRPNETAEAQLLELRLGDELYGTGLP
jgi:hypothetical protein